MRSAPDKLYFVSLVERRWVDGVAETNKAVSPVLVFARNEHDAHEQARPLLLGEKLGPPNWTLDVERASPEQAAAERTRAREHYKRLGWSPCCDLAVLSFSAFVCPAHGRTSPGKLTAAE